MTSRLYVRTALSLALAAIPASIVAQAAWVPGSELVGQSVQVTTNGVSNTVHFDPNGYARIVTPGGREVSASWTANAQQLCLNSGSGAECWPYSEAFQAGRSVTLTSNCNATSTWVANGVNPPPHVEKMGERG